MPLIAAETDDWPLAAVASPTATPMSMYPPWAIDE